MGSISMPQGKGSQMHNRRDYGKIGRDIPENIDRDKMEENVTLVDTDLREAYDQIFGEAVDRYNNKQTRQDRKIDSYMDKIAASKNGEKLFYEDIIQWGKKEDFEASPHLREIAKNALIEYAQTFQERNPNLRVIGAYIHMDEASPHMHLDYIPVAHGYSRGMDTRNSLDKALREQGVELKERTRTVKDKETGEEKEITLTTSGRYNNATMAWKEAERAHFGEICRSHGLEVDAERRARGSLTIEEYKEAKDRLIAPLQEQAQALRDGGYYTNEQGEREYIEYDDSIKHLEHEHDHLSQNATSYKQGGWFFDRETHEGFTIPEGGIELAVKTAQENVRTAQDELNEIRTENDTLKNENTVLGQNKLSLEGDLQALANQKLGAETSLTSLRWEYGAYLNGWTDPNGVQQPGINQLRQKYDELQSGVTKEQEQFDALWTKYTKTADERDRMKAEIGQLTTEKDSLAADIDNMKAEYNELNGKIKSLQQIDKIQSQIKENKPKISTIEVSDGLLKGTHTVTVVEGYAPKELKNVFAAATLNHKANETIHEAEKKADSIIQEAHSTVEEAQRIQANADMIRQEADDYAKRKREEAAKEVQAAQEKAKTAEAEYAKYLHGWTDEQGQHMSLPRAAETYKQGMTKLKEQADKITEYNDRIEGLEKDIADNEALSLWKPTEQDLREAASATITHNLVHDTTIEVLHSLDNRGLLRQSTMDCLRAIQTKDILDKVTKNPDKLLDNLREEQAIKANREGRSGRSHH